LCCAEAPGGGLAIHWIERGGPLLPVAPERQGFGTRLLRRSLVQDLGAGAMVELRFEPAGLTARIEFHPMA
jgi:two-component sensor histidine kinase